MIHYIQCPVCGKQDLSEISSVKDFLISGESFAIWKCSNCGLLFTQDVPDEQESIRYYQSEKYISHSDTDSGLVNKLYHLVRTYTLRRKKALIRKEAHPDRGELLDIGSGTGSFLNTMKQAGWSVTGVEPDETARGNSLKLHQIQSLDLDNAAHLPSDSFDVITMWHVLEHVHQLEFRMQELKRMIRQEGRIFIAVPNHTSYDARHYGAAWAAWDVPRHLYHFSPESMRFLCNKFGLSIERIVPMWFDSFYISLLSQQYKTRKKNLLVAFLVGFVSNLEVLINRGRCSSLIYIIRKK